MEMAEKKKLTTRDMARAECDKGIITSSNEDAESFATAATEVGVPTLPNSLNRKAPEPVLSTRDGKDFQSRWQDIQTGFVDEPRRAVERADELVAEMMQHLAQSFSDQRSRLESEWEHSEKVSTEELRLALRSYRSFFDRLLSV